MALTKIKKCPCCQQEVSDYIWVDRQLFHLGPMQTRLVTILRQAPEGLTNDAIMERLYQGRRNGGPDNVKIVSVMACHINKKMAPHGLAIRGTGGPGSIFRLVETQP